AFLVRPLGAIFFGHLGDRMGRRISLLACISLMGVASTIIGLLPTYAQIGAWAPALLVLMRLLQGFSAGGEVGGAATYIREWAPEHLRPFYISFIPSVAQIGKALAAAMAGVAAALTTPEAMADWGWRIPFLLTFPLAILALALRTRVGESPEHAAASAAAPAVAGAPSPFRSLMVDHRAQLAKVVIISAIQSIGTYLGTVYVATYLSVVLGFSKASSSMIVLVAVLVAAVAMPIFGYLSSRLGGRWLLLWSYVMYALVSIPSFMLMAQNSFALAIAGLCLGMLPYALCQVGTYSVIPEFFPAEVRHSGVAFGHSVGAVIGGASMPFLATVLINWSGNTMVPAYILSGAGLIGFVIVTLFVRHQSAGHSHLYQ
ncbi:MAG: MFS transporter, partial [Burkholderiales bacterium]